VAILAGLLVEIFLFFFAGFLVVTLSVSVGLVSGGAGLSYTLVIHGEYR
jgi:hypothetical protein